MKYVLVFTRHIRLGSYVGRVVGPFETYEAGIKWYNELKLTAKVNIPYAECLEIMKECYVQNL